MSRFAIKNSQCFLRLLIVISFLFVTAVLSGQPCDDGFSVDVTNGEYFSDGRVVFDGMTYTKDYIYSKNVSGEMKTFGCACEQTKCFRKCCPKGSVLNVTTRSCAEAEWLDIILNDGFNLYSDNLFRKNLGMDESGFGFLYGKPVVHMYLERQKWFLQEDGQLYIEMPMKIPPWTLRTPDKYCVDTFVYTDETGKQTTKLDALVCFAGESYDVTSYVTTSACMLISCVFILATVAVYAWLPELRNLHGRVLVAYLLCLFISFIFLSTMKILLLIDQISSNMCVIFTFLIYFFLLSSFFWLNVMSFDIWWTFSGKRGLSLERLTINARFGAYALYAFSIPIVLTVIMASLEFSGLPMHPLMPNIRHQGCFLYGKSKLLYLYGPMVVLCLANMIFFILTATKIAQIKQQTSVLKSKESTTHDQQRKDQQRLFLYVKLFIVMGINWLLEVISSLYPAASGLWWITDAYNVLIGLTIFIIFVCKRKIFRLMKKRLGECLGRENVSEGMKRVSTRDRMDWITHQNQRASLDTIKSSLGIDNDSVKTKTTQC